MLFGMKTEEGQRPFYSCGRATVTTCRCRWGALLDAPAAVGERCSTPVVSVDGQRLLVLDSFVLVEAPRPGRSLCATPLQNTQTKSMLVINEQEHHKHQPQVPTPPLADELDLLLGRVAGACLLPEQLHRRQVEHEVEHDARRHRVRGDGANAILCSSPFFQ